MLILLFSAFKSFAVAMLTEVCDVFFYGNVLRISKAKIAKIFSSKMSLSKEESSFPINLKNLFDYSSNVFYKQQRCLRMICCSSKIYYLL